ncbi:MAG: lipoyl(octanoyl) transferase LipB [Candidatus Omnitrophota bacterium]|nr:lipoyl(octanoyl) transferase LipB [Candidatus Omnitrophota bacterium]
MNLKIIDPGLVDFDTAWQKQKELFAEVKSGRLKHALLICRHNPVITIGRSGLKANILAKEIELDRKKIAVYEVERGGDVTYHGPGQLTVYPILNLNYLKKDIHWFLRYLEGLIIFGLKDFGIGGERKEGLTGVWVGKRKIASIGIAVRNWISFHGFSINIKRDDLINFSLIRPCGMDIMVTSVESETGKETNVEQVKKSFISLLANRSVAEPSF